MLFVECRRIFFAVPSSKECAGKKQTKENAARVSGVHIH